MPKYRIISEQKHLNFQITTRLIIEQNSFASDEFKSLEVMNIVAQITVPIQLYLQAENIENEIKRRLESKFPLQSVTDTTSSIQKQRNATPEEISNFIKTQITFLAREYLELAHDIKNGDEIGLQYHHPSSMRFTRN